MPNGRYRDPAPYLDGGTLPEGTGMLVVAAPRHGASAVEVSVDQHPAGNAPVTLTLPAGFHAVRFRAGIITSYQFATVRAGVAVMVDAPSDR